MRHSLIIYVLFFWIPTNFVKAKKSRFGPVFKYENGEYWGASRFDDTLAIRIPHGRGTYVSNDKSVKFHGEWNNGEPYHGNRYYKVSYLFFFHFHFKFKK